MAGQQRLVDSLAFLSQILFCAEAASVFCDVLNYILLEFLAQSDKKHQKEA